MLRPAQKGDKCEISNILFAKSDSTYVRASVVRPEIGGRSHATRAGARWKVIDLGSSDIGCDNTSRRVRRELQLVCTGDSSGGQQAAPPPPVATASESRPLIRTTTTGDKHFAVYYLQVKNDGLATSATMFRQRPFGFG